MSLAEGPGYEVRQSSHSRFVRALEDWPLQELPSHRASRPHRQDPRSRTTVDQGVQSAKVRVQRSGCRGQGTEASDYVSTHPGTSPCPW